MADFLTDGLAVGPDGAYDIRVVPWVGEPWVQHRVVGVQVDGQMVLRLKLCEGGTVSVHPLDWREFAYPVEIARRLASEKDAAVAKGSKQSVDRHRDSHSRIGGQRLGRRGEVRSRLI